MKSRTLISLVQCVVMGVVAVNLMAMIYRVTFEQDLFDITWVIMATVLGGSAGALVRYLFVEDENDAPSAVSGAQPSIQAPSREFSREQSPAIHPEVESPVHENASVILPEVNLDQNTDSAPVTVHRERDTALESLWERHTASPAKQPQSPTRIPEAPILTDPEAMPASPIVVKSPDDPAAQASSPLMHPAPSHMEPAEALPHVNGEVGVTEESGIEPTVDSWIEVHERDAMPASHTNDTEESPKPQDVLKEEPGEAVAQLSLLTPAPEFELHIEFIPQDEPRESIIEAQDNDEAPVSLSGGSSSRSVILPVQAEEPEEIPIEATDRQDDAPADREREELHPAAPHVTAALEDRIFELERFQETLHQEIRFLRHFIDGVPAFLVVLDPDDKVILMNTALAGALGYSADEVKGLEFTSNFVAPQSRRDAWSLLLADTATSDGPFTTEIPVWPKDAKEVPVEWHGTPVSDSDGELSYCFLVGIDVSARIHRDKEVSTASAWDGAEEERSPQPQPEQPALEGELDEELPVADVENAHESLPDSGSPFLQLYEEANRTAERFRAALDVSPDAMVMYDREGSAVYASPALTSAFGWSLEDLRGMETPFVPPAQKDLEKSAMEAIQRGGAPCCDLVTQRECKDGRLVGTRFTASLFRDGNGDPAGMLVILRDVTDLPTVRPEPEEPVGEPAKRQVSAKEIVKQIRAGVTDAELMEKYKLTAKGLQSLFQKLLKAKVLKPSEIYNRLSSYDETVAIELGRLFPAEPREPPRKTIKSSQIKADIRSGETDSDIMAKYGISSDGLDKIFNQMVTAGVISADEVRRNSEPELEPPVPEPLPAAYVPLSPDAEDPEDETTQRRMRRHYMVVSVPIYEADNLLNEGIIIDISELGIKIQGIPTELGATKSLLIQGDGFHDVYPFVFDAVCRWSRTDDDTGETLAGYEITEISDKSLEELRKLIAALSITS